MRPIKFEALLRDLRTSAARAGLVLDMESGRGSHVILRFRDPGSENSLALVLVPGREISPLVQRAVLASLGRAAASNSLAPSILALLETQFGAASAPIADDAAEVVATRNFISGGPREESEEIFDIGAELASELGYDLSVRNDLERGSWIRDIFLSGKKALANKEVQERAEAIEDALFGHANIDVDLKVVEMTAKLVTALAGSDSDAAVVDSGLFLFIKLPDGAGKYHIFSKRLTRSDRAILNEDPTIVQTPAAVLERLKDARKIRAERLREIEAAASALLGDQPDTPAVGEFRHDGA